MEEEKKNRITAWVRGHKKYTAAACAAVIVIAAAVYLIGLLREYSAYEVVSSAVHSRESNDQYIRFSGNIVQYGGDGITCLDTSGSSLWSKSYEMEQPLLAASDEYLAAADQGGNVIYLFNNAGFLTQIETPYPIRQLDVADNGYTAAVLEESDACRLVLYDMSGNAVVEGQAHLDDNGYPAAIALSQDGTVLAVSYLTVSTGTLSTDLVFYDFSDTESGTAQSAASYTYTGEMIVRLARIGGKFAAFSGEYVRIYAAGSLTLNREIAFDSEVQSIVIGEDRFGIVTAADEEEAAEISEDPDLTDASADASAGAKDVWSIDIYGKGGTRITHAVFTGDYQSIALLENGSAAVLGTDSCTIITALGRTRYSGIFDEGICAVFSNSGFSGYTFVFSDRIDRIRLQ